MTDTNALKESIAQYESQLAQVQIALSATPKGPDKDNLLSLQSDIQELINLTKENLESLENNESENSNSFHQQDPLDREYALFKAELGESPGDSENCDVNEMKAEAANDIEEDLEALEGMKCRAPHGSSWGGIGYHNAMVWSVHREENESISSLNDIKVRVVFLNPTHKEMLPCPYFLEGDCKFSEDQCHFSHGEIVPLSSLQEYREPDFSNIKMGSRVLAKQNNKLWHRCVVLKVPEKTTDLYRVKFEASGKIFEAMVQDLLPLDDSDLQMSDTSSDEDEATNTEIDEQEIIHSALLSVDSTQPLGNWEQHTRGIGSKIMTQMGYIIGTGLGKKADGRVQPVEATVLPAGKSLDHCMQLREMANGDKNLFSAERKMRKEKLKLERKQQKDYEKEQRLERSNVFNFINDTLGSSSKTKNEPSCSKQSSQIQENLSKIKSISDKKLNITNFQIGENISKLEKESIKLKDSLTKHSKNSPAYNNISLRFNNVQKEIKQLRASEKNIASEQRNRKSREKLSIF